MTSDQMTAERAAYFLRRFKSDEKMLGPSEQAALDYAIEALTNDQTMQLDFRIEQRGTTRVLVEDAGGCRPATTNECALWDAVQALTSKPAGAVVWIDPADLSDDPVSLMGCTDAMHHLGDNLRYTMPLYAAPTKPDSEAHRYTIKTETGEHEVSLAVFAEWQKSEEHIAELEASQREAASAPDVPGGDGFWVPACEAAHARAALSNPKAADALRSAMRSIITAALPHIPARQLSAGDGDAVAGYYHELERLYGAPVAAGVPDGWRDDVSLAAQMLTWGEDDGLTEVQAFQVRQHQRKLLGRLDAPEQQAVPEDVRRNAERYRWLRDKANGANKSAPMVAVSPLDFSNMRLIHSDELDAAIDAAMAASGVSNG